MAKRENPNLVPKKFRNLKKSFLNNLQDKNSFFFRAFPSRINFYGKEKDENIVLIVRRHWIVYLPYMLTTVILFVLPILLSSLVESKTTLFAIFFASIATALSVSVFAFVKWFYNVNIITDQRVLDLDFTSVVSHSLAEARLEKIVDVTHKQIGVVGSVFDVGTVFIQTAGSTPEIQFCNILRPRKVQDVIYDLLESKGEGKI